MSHLSPVEADAPHVKRGDDRPVALIDGKKPGTERKQSYVIIVLNDEGDVTPEFGRAGTIASAGPTAPKCPGLSEGDVRCH